jgi:hypothetical protein
MKLASRLIKYYLPNKYMFSLIRSSSNKSDKIKMKPEPTQCCGTGCQNCSWIKYTDELLEYYKDLKNEKDNDLNKILNEIQKIEDPIVRDFLIMEIKFKFK